LTDSNIDKFSRKRYESSLSNGERLDHLPDEEGDDEEEEGLVGEGKQSRIKLKRALIISGSVLLALAIGAAIYAAFFMSKVSEEISLSDKVKGELAEVLVEPDSSDDPFYMLIIGSDSRDAGNAQAGLSDTVMLARIDPETPQLTILSIPRDVEIWLEGYGAQKINAAYTYGGPAGSVTAVSELCGVPISYYVEIDFSGMTSLVDALGGIEVDVPCEIYLDGVYIAPGPQRLNGAQALIMSRSRDFPTGDLVRVENQRIILKSIIKEILASSVVEMPGLVATLATYVGTTMEVTRAVELVMKFRGTSVDQMYMATMPVAFNTHDGIAFLRVVEPDFSEMMARIEQGLPPIDPDAAPVEYY